MKTNFKSFLKRITTITLVLVMVFSVTTTGFAAQETWNKGQKVNYVASSSDTTYEASEWTKNLVDLYQLKWYEDPTRQVLKGEFMLVQLRIIQASLERQGLDKLSADKEVLSFKDNNTLTASAQEEAKILKSLGILSGNSDGYMNMTAPIKRSEAAKVLAFTNSKVLKIPSVRNSKIFSDTKGHWAERSISIAYQICLLNGISATAFGPNDPLTLEQTLQILENEVGYFGIKRVDVVKAMNETFKVTLNADLSNSIITNGSYVKYEEKMKTYQFDKLYNNQSAKSSEYVTKAEALKLAAAVSLNVDDVSSSIGEHDEYLNAVWVEFAKLNGITKEDINSSNYNDKATYIDVISYFENCKVGFLKDYTVKTADVHLKDLDKYSAEQQAAIKDMVANQIVYLLADALHGNEYISKGQLNEIIINFAEKYNTIVMEGDKINTDPEKMPLNANLYPYILSNVDKAIYEMPLITDYQVKAINPKDMYAYRKDCYPQIKEYTEAFFNVILNIDYRTITEENFKEQMAPYLVFAPNESVVKNYVKYVKANEIILEGSAKFYAPVVYYDGSSYRARMELKFNVIHSKTNVNLLYLDRFDVPKTYQKTSYDIFSDFYLAAAMGTHNLYISQWDLYNSILDKEHCGITKEAYSE